MPAVHAEELLHGLHFDGRTSIAITNVSDLLMDEAYTVEMWVNPSAGSGEYGLFYKGGAWGGGAKCLKMKSFRPTFSLCNVVYPLEEVGPNLAVESGSWSHLAWTVSAIDASQRIYRVYINGDFNGSFTNVTMPDEGTIEIGRLGRCCEGFVGDMVDVRFWNVARSQTDIQDYLFTSPGSDTNLIGHWLFMQGVGTNVYDEAGLHNGIINGAGNGSNAWISISPAPGVVSPTLKGLWIGYAEMSRVSRAPASSAVTNTWDYSPTNTTQRFPLRLLLHIDENGGMRLLPEIYLAGTEQWQVMTNYTGTAMTNASDGTVISNRVWNWLLYRSADRVPADSAAVQRFSSTAFPPGVGPVILWGASTQLTGRLILDYDDPHNPFVHRYHPDHDNRDSNGQLLAEGRESWTIRRDLLFEFADENPDEAADPHWKVDRWGGSYSEQINGLHRFPLYVEGVFNLQRVNHIGTIE